MPTLKGANQKERASAAKIPKRGLSRKIGKMMYRHKNAFQIKTSRQKEATDQPPEKSREPAQWLVSARRLQHLGEVEINNSQRKRGGDDAN